VAVHEQEVVWDGLAEEWSLSAEERALIDRQQGSVCVGCGSNVRSMALAKAVLRGLRLEALLSDLATAMPALRVLEVNGAGSLTPFFDELEQHVLTAYPEVDMTALPFADDSFDLVVHSDTLEHIPDPVVGLRECLRVAPLVCFTAPTLVGRLSRARTGLPPSFHHGESAPSLVHTEFGADLWWIAMQSGPAEVAVTGIEAPAGLAWTLRRP
jgi:SAM-dependent methyltransferase